MNLEPVDGTLNDDSQATFSLQGLKVITSQVGSEYRDKLEKTEDRSWPRCEHFQRRFFEQLRDLLAGGMAPAALAGALAVGMLVGSMPPVPHRPAS